MAKKSIQPGKPRKSTGKSDRGSAAKTFQVAGRISNRRTGQGVPGLTVQAFHQEKQAAGLLGSTQTDAEGRFAIAYTDAQLARAEKGGADLFVRVLDRQGRVLATSETRLNAAGKAVINLEVELPQEPGSSEYERLAAELKPLVPDVSFEDLEEEDIVHLAEESGHPEAHIHMLREAARNAAKLMAPPELLYALQRKGMGGGLEGLAKHERAQLVEALRAAVTEGIIGGVEPAELDRLLGRVAQARADNAPLQQILEGSHAEGSARVVKFLAGRGVRSLGELRSLEGFRALAELEGDRPDPTLELLRAHVNLSMLAPDARLRSTLVAKNYRKVGDVAATTLEEFTDSTKGQLDPHAAAVLHTQAVVMQRVLKKNLLEAQLERTRAAADGPDYTGSPVMRVLFDSDASCACEDCQSAVSPLAYLADLLKYCSDNLRDTAQPAGQQRVDYHRLVRELHQNFADLPAECGAVEEQVHQVRIAIEVLRSYLQAAPPATSAANPLARAEREYLRAAYESLLLHAGASYTDLRLGLIAPAEEQSAFAERLGVAAPGAAGNPLRDLSLDIAAAPLVTLESKLEELFGLKDTRQGPLAAKPVPKLLTWRRAHLRDVWFAQDWPDDSPGPGAPLIDPDVIGPDDFRDLTANKGAFEIWVRRRKWVDGQLSDLSQRTPPANTSRLDAMLDAMYGTTGAAALPAYPLRGGALNAARAWPAATPRSAFLSMSDVLGSGDKTAVARVSAALAGQFGLAVDAYNRLTTLHARDAARRADARNPALTEAETREFVSILAGARKRLHFDDWLREERAALQSTDSNVLFQFGPRDFWIALTEPEPGDWPPLDDGRSPWIDPDLAKLTDLPDSAVGDAARALWSARRQELATRREAIATARRQGFAQALLEALGTTMPAGFTAWGAFIDDTLQKLGGAPADVILARQRLDQTLFLAEDPFRRLMIIWAKDAGTDPAQKPSAVEYDEAELILLGAYKRRALYPAWWTAERGAAAPLSDWQALKMRLPEWRGAADVRAAWQYALRLRYRPALIDPDLINEAHLSFDVKDIPAGAAAAGAESDELAARLWRDRETQLSETDTTSQWNRIKSAREAAAAAADKGFSAALSAAGLTVANLDDLGARVDSGRTFARRLDQLSLDTESFEYLARIRQLLAGNQTVEAPEWAEVYSILLQVWKRRNTAAWRDEERKTGVVLGPDCFKLPVPDLVQFPPALPPEPPRWRATLQARAAWEDKLQARLDQEAALQQALHKAVEAVEEECLPQLRDALIQAVSVATPGDKARILADRLLIELKGAGCLMTTRVAQAIETIQNLLFSVRTGQLLDTYPTWALTPGAAADFDGVWLWLGSYATWRSAMLVLLYPENLLVPGLRRERTPAFDDLLDDLSSGGALSGTTAGPATQAFVDYLRDICQLEITASPEVRSAFRDARLPMPASTTGLARFLFGVSRQTRRLYWSIVYRGQTGGEIQSPWRRFEQFKQDVTKVLGASVYKVPDPNFEKRYLYVFVAVTEDAEDAIYFARFDLLGEGRWLPDEAEKLDTKEYKHFTAQLLSTAETTPPAIRLTIDSQTSINYQLGVDGFATSLQVSQAAVPSDWSSARSSFLTSADGRTCGGLAFRSGASHDLVIFELSTRDDGQNYYGHVRIAQGMDANGNFAGSAGVWNPIGPQGPRYPEWQFGALTPGNHPGGCAIAVADVDGNGQDDLIMVWTTPGTHAGDPSSVECRVGLGLKNDGKADSWLDEKDAYGFVPMFSDAMENTGPCAVAFLGRSSGGFDLLIAGAGGADRRSIWLRKVHVKLPAQDRRLEFSNIRSYYGTPAAAREVTGLGIALRDLNGDGARDLLLHYTERTGPGSVDGWLRFAASADADGFPIGSWGNPVKVDSSLYQQVSGADFGSPLGAGLALMSRSGSPAKTDAVIASFPANPQASNFQYIVAGDISLEYAFYEPESVNMGRYKPVLPPPNAGSAFEYGVGPQRSPTVTPSAASSANSGKTRINRVLIEEAFFFAPLAVALQLQRAGDYLAALDWFRSVFDYTAPRDARALYPGLDSGGGVGVWRAENWAWLEDPLDPHSIAQGRKGAYKRFIQQAIVRCLLDYADAEFTRNTEESISLARLLYLTALDLLDDPDLNQTFNGCQAFIDRLTFVIGQLDDPASAGAKEDIATLARTDFTPSDYVAIAAALNSAYARGRMTAGEAQAIHAVVENVQARQDQAPLTFDGMFSGQQLLDERLNQALFSGDIQMQDLAVLNGAVAGTLNGGFVEGYGFGGAGGGAAYGAGGFGGFGPVDPPEPGGDGLDGGFVNLVPGNINTIPWKYEYEPPNKLIETGGSGRHGSHTPAPPVLAITTCIPPNPILRALRLRAELNLYKLRTCRSITGELQQVEPYAAATDTRTGLPSIGSGGQLILPGLAALAPTPYRFSVLLERARSLVQLAQQTESAMLAALQAGDTERYNAFKARQDLESAKANVKLQSLRVHEAQSNIVLTQLQQERAQLQIDQYNEWLSAGLSDLEEASLALTAKAITNYVAAASASFSIQDYAGGFGSGGQAWSMTAGVLSTLASYERRQQEWVFQRRLAQEDRKIAAQQTYIAQDQLRVVTQEQTIASLTEDHTSATIEFLARKFTNSDLYDWMANVLNGVYRYFLQQAAGMARLAAAQLAFERQEAPPPFIQADYWSPPPEAGSPAADVTKTPDRRGLTGSARLLQDITQLDQYAFTTDQRRLQLSKTISIAQLAPLEFQRFRETGVLTFATPLDLFDRDFPGQYMRLVHRVKVSVAALIPPAQGIRATLTADRISRVVIGGDQFQTIRVSRGPDMVSLSSPREATGLFELDIQPGMLAPFEAIGVDTTWELRLPAAANPFDFDTIADILFTIDYTALHSFEYQQQVVQRLGRRLSARRAWSFRYNLADQWYDLNNPGQSQTPMTVQFATREEEFPANIAPDSLAIEDLTLHFVRRDGVRFELPNVRLRFREEETTAFVGGTAGTQDGTITSSSGAAGSWASIQTRSPVGTWELSLPNSEEIRDRFRSGDLLDILLVLTYSGRLPEWPL